MNPPLERLASWTGAACWLLLLQVLLPGPASAAAPPAQNSGTNGSMLRLMNRDIFLFQAPSGLFTAEQRREGFERLIEDAIRADGGGVVSTQLSETNAVIRIDDRAVSILGPADVNPLAGETLDSIAGKFAQRLQIAVQEAKELGDHRHLARSIAAVGGSTLLLILVIALWVTRRARIEDWLMRLGVRVTESVRSGTMKTLSRQNLVGTVRTMVGALMWLTILTCGYLWLEFTLRAFPTTRPLGERLGLEMFFALVKMGHGIMRSLPDLGVILVIWFAARFVSASVRRFFYAAERGHFRSQLFDSATAPMTSRLVIVLVWIAALIVAFPYIPGSDTEAFKGVSVLAGLMVSLGSGGIVGQVIAGLVAVYTRCARPGDYVRIAETEGTIEKIGLFNTTIRTVKNEQAHLPNQMLTSQRTLNYTRRAETEVLWLHTEITIGYDAPWRQVHAMLEEAARRTAGLVMDPGPFVLQTALEDFYTRYQVNAVLEKPERRIPVLAALHAHIQDVFNEYGVQIMSPNYRSDPPQKVVVPKERWFTPPARQDNGAAGTPAPPAKAAPPGDPVRFG